MPGYKETVLKRFDGLIAELAALLENVPRPSNDRYSRGRSDTMLSPEQADTFFAIRDRYLELLISIPVKDDALVNAIDHVRDIDLYRFNVDRVLHTMRNLRSDFAAGIFDASRSTAEKSARSEQMLREAYFEVENFAAPYPDIEVDRLEKLIKSAVRQAFGEKSSQFEEIHLIFHPPSAGVRFISSADPRPTKAQIAQRHNEAWNDRRQKLLNSLEIMLKEARQAEVAETAQASDSAKLQLDLDRAQRRIELILNIACSVAALSTAVVALVVLRSRPFYSVPNQLLMDITISVSVGLGVLVISRRHWRRNAFILLLASVLLGGFAQALEGVR